MRYLALILAASLSCGAQISTINPNGGGGGGGGTVTGSTLYIWTAAASLPVALSVQVVVKTITTTSIPLPNGSNWAACTSGSTTCPMYTVKDATGLASGSNPVIVVAADGKLIDGASSKLIQSQYGSITMVYDGTGWNTTVQVGY